MASKSDILPYAHTYNITLVFLVIAFSMVCLVKHKLTGSTSAKTGLAPALEMELGSAEWEKLGTIISSPSLMPKAFMPEMSAAVALAKATEYFLLQILAKRFSNSRVYLFSDNQLRFITSVTKRNSSFPIDGS